jgi:hypothetical protein
MLEITQRGSVTTTHNPSRQADWLRQTLAHDKTPIGLLLGAGCPAAIRTANNAPLIPDIGGLTALVGERISASAMAPAYARLEALLRNDLSKPPSVEDMLTFIRALRTVAGTTGVRDLQAHELDSLDQHVCTCIAETVNQTLPEGATAYHRLAAWIGAIQRSTAVEAFTTNYDLLLEQALEALRVPYFDGFVGSYRSFFDTYAIDHDGLPARWARVWKVHGSVNWARDLSGNVHRRGREAQGDCVIHPSHLKYDESRRMPYIALMDRLRSFLRRPSAFLLTCGYSFKDQHVNEIILEGLRGNPTATVFGLMYGNLENYAEAVQGSTRRPNLGILATDEAVVGTRRGKWSDGRADIAPRTAAIDWTASTGDRAAASFRLGDFGRLGEFIQDLIGSGDHGLSAT